MFIDIKTDDNYSRTGEKAPMIVDHFCLGQNMMVQIPILSFLQLAL